MDDPPGAPPVRGGAKRGPGAAADRGSTNTPPGAMEAGAEPVKRRRTAKPNHGQRRPANPHLTEPDRKGGTRVHQAPCPSLPEPATPGVNQQSLQDEGNECLTLAEPDWERERQGKIHQKPEGQLA